MNKTVKPSHVAGTVCVPCSKSYAQRAFAAALLANGESILEGIELCDDTKSAIRVIGSLGAKVHPIAPSTYAVQGGLDPVEETINTGESGLSTRLFTPIAALCDRRITVTGKGTMLRRPIGMMIRPLENLGVEVVSNGFLPISVKGPIRGGQTEVDGFVSSQFLTGLLTALPLAENDTTLFIETLNSIPYINMTIDTARRFGIRIEHNDFHEFYIPGNQSFTPTNFRIEGDWSSAAFMLVAGAMTGEVTVKNMKAVSMQADVAIIDAMSAAGAEIVTTENEITVRRRNLHGFDFDATHCPDLFPILTVLAAGCEGKSVFKGVKRLIYKESNRAEAIVSEFTKMGIDIELIDEDYLQVNGGNIHGAKIDSRNDHRIAMAAAVAALSSDSPVTIRHAEAVAKSYPDFWLDLASITHTPTT